MIILRNFAGKKVIQNNENVIFSEFREREAQHRKYKRLKLGGGEAYDPSSD
jgi:hypothetical protein